MRTSRVRVVSVLSVVALAGIFLMPQAYGAPDFYVTNNATGSGTSWADAASLTNALASAAVGNEIWIAQGTYTSTSTFTIATSDLQIYGGFDGTETLLGQRDFTNHVVLLDGENTRRVVDIQADNILLDGLVITNGFQNTDHGSGLRMNNSGTDLTVLNCQIVGNRHSKDGGYGAGAYFNSAGVVLLSNTVIRANISTIRCLGVGFRSDSTTMTLMDCEVSDNEDTGGDMRAGKGFYLGSGTLTMVNTVVTNNFFASDDSRRNGPGGGGYINGTASFTNCIFNGNDSSRSSGAGLYVNGGDVTIESCTFVANGAKFVREERIGGAIYQNNGTVTIRNSIFWGNEAGTNAAAGHTIYQAGGTLNISYSCMDGIELPQMRLASGTLGDGIITNDPQFATEYSDVHLKSKIGRWNGSSWVQDTTNSPCIDTGDPTSDYSNEPAGEDGARINMGAYGNTWQASKSTNEVPTVETLPERVVATAAELKGVLASGAVSTVSFYYGLSDAGASPAGWDATNVLSEDQWVGKVFSSVAGGLQPSQTYWYRVYATNAFGEGWSDAVNFSTGTAAPGGGPGVIHVDADSTGVEDGLSWTNAFTTLEDALAAADAGLGSSIWIAEGGYQGLEPFAIRTKGLSVYGGFDGTETLLSQRDWANNVVLLDGENTRRVMDIQASDVLLDGLIITNGHRAALNTDYGAGIFMNDSGTNLTMLNCRVDSNRLSPTSNGNGSGAGIYLRNAGIVLFSNCVIRANWTSVRVTGMGLYSQNTDLTFIDCEIRGNYNSGDARDGAGFYVSGGTLTMLRTTVADNDTNSPDSNGHGGGGYITGANASFTNCIFTGNDCGTCDGAGLRINSGDVTIDSCTFAGNAGNTNSTSHEGGAIYQTSGTVTINNSIFWGNNAGNDGNDGDSIYQGGGTMNISYSCIEGTNAPHLVSTGTLNLNAGIITNDPLFAVEFTDVHLQSKGGRWNGLGWVADKEDSPCIDAGDPASDDSRETDGKYINMGAYGNTPEASRLSKVGTVLRIR